MITVCVKTVYFQKTTRSFRQPSQYAPDFNHIIIKLRRTDVHPPSLLSRDYSSISMYALHKTTQ